MKQLKTSINYLVFAYTAVIVVKGLAIMADDVIELIKDRKK